MYTPNSYIVLENISVSQNMVTTFIISPRNMSYRLNFTTQALQPRYKYHSLHRLRLFIDHLIAHSSMLASNPQKKVGGCTSGENFNRDRIPPIYCNRKNSHDRHLSHQNFQIISAKLDMEKLGVEG